MTSALLSGTDLRSVLRNVPTPVAFIATHTDWPLGMIVGSFVSISLEPPLVGVFIQKSSSTWPDIERALVTGQELGISLLGAEHAEDIRQLSGPAENRFAENISWSGRSGGAVLLDGADATLNTRLHDLQDIGDHYFAVLEVTAAGTDADHSSALVFHRSRISSL